MKKTYSNRKEVLGKLEEIITELHASGAKFLPSERKLATMVGASRETLRCCLEEMERNELLHRGLKSRILSTKKKPGLNVVFLCNGVETILSPVWARFWEIFRKASKNSSFNLSLSLLNWIDNKKLFKEFSREAPDIIVLSDFPGLKLERELLAELKSLNSIMITVNEQYKDYCDYCVALDNFAAGKLAAKTLLEAGYEKPIFLGPEGDLPHFPFLKSSKGFASALEEHGVTVNDSSIRWLKAKKRTTLIRKIIHETECVAEKDFDSMFLYSDEQVEFVYEILNEHTPIPERYGLITVASTEEALRHTPPITSVSHSDNRTVEALIKLINKISEGEKISSRHISIKPKILRGGTVREI